MTAVNDPLKRSLIIALAMSLIVPWPRHLGFDSTIDRRELDEFTILI